MTTKEAFENASLRSKQLVERPSNEDLLKLYGFYKQATEGDISGQRPNGFDFKGAAKYDAWKLLKGISTEEAMSGYIDLVNKLHHKE